MMHHPIQCSLPHVSSKFDHSVEGAVDTRLEFLRRHAGGEVLVLGTHFAGPTAGWLVSHGETRHFVVEKPAAAD